MKWVIPAVLCLLSSFVTPIQAQEIAIGDSIACGLKTAGHLQGGCKIGASPQAVAEMVWSYPSDLYKDQVVILSCGASNNPQQLEYCLKDMDWIVAHGGKIVLLGVGEVLPDSPEINDLLKAYADVHDAIFVWGWHDVHPQSYQIVLKAIRNKECSSWRICET